MLWRIRARLRDCQTGEEIDLRTKRVAAELCTALERADAGELQALPRDASPFSRYEVMSVDDDWHYVRRAEGALDHEPFGRTRSTAFALRVAEVMNRANPRKLRDPYAPPKAGWF
jgi:hypothetical protein